MSDEVQYDQQGADDAGERSETHTGDALQTRVPVVRQLMVAFSILGAVFGVTYLTEFTGLFSDAERPVAAISGENTSPERADDPFSGISLQGKAAFVWDVKEQRALYSQNADEQLPLASVAKLMTALVAEELLGGRADVTIGAAAIMQDGDSGFLGNERFTSRDLMDLTLITSSNDGAYALAAAGEQVIREEGLPHSFIDAMNIRADELGLSKTYFNNPTGLDESIVKSGAYGSARDAAFLMEYLLTEHPEILELTSSERMHIENQLGQVHLAANTNSVVRKIPGIIGSKTGYTELAGGNLVIAFDGGLNHPIVIAVLGSTTTGRFSDTLALMEAARERINQ